MALVRQRVALVAAAFVVAAAVSACGTATPSPTSPARLENGQIVFPEGSAQISSFATDAVKESGPLQLRLTGRLVWDETARCASTRFRRPRAADPGEDRRARQQGTDAREARLARLRPGAGRRAARAVDFALAEKNLSRVRELNAAASRPARTSRRRSRLRTRGCGARARDGQG